MKRFLMSHEFSFFASMRIAIISNDEQKSELLEQGVVDHDELYWLTNPEPIDHCDCYIDLLFESSDERIESLRKLNPPLVLVNDVMRERELPASFIAFNGWMGFLRRPLVEVSDTSLPIRKSIEEVFSVFGKKTEWVPDHPGFISARVVSMIINEAYLALGEGVSTRQEIDTAMKLGTNYPYGPFEWSALIGTRNVYRLLRLLAKHNSRYEPAALLTDEARP
jgi:3-hydroxybutyryl-CoA dehydrogenase